MFRSRRLRRTERPVGHASAYERFRAPMDAIRENAKRVVGKCYLGYDLRTRTLKGQ